MADVIPNASYCIFINTRNPACQRQRHEAQFYDIDGLPLMQIPLERDEWWDESIPRFTKMLDHQFVGKARPGKIVIENCPKRGRCVWFYDRNGNLISYRWYDGPTDLDSIATILNKGPCDSTWMLTHNIPVVDNTIEELTMCAIL